MIVSKPSSGGRSPQLDGLRGLAILMVFFHHSGWKLPHEWDWGQMGVRLFFVLSGYLITLSLWKIEDRAGQLRVGYAGELGIFHLRRLARLLPAFLAALAFGAIVGMQDVIEPILWHLAFLSNFKMAMQGWFFGPTAHFWSLSLQEQFYVVWPFFLLAVPRRWFPAVALGLVALGYGYRVWCITAGVSDYWRWLMMPGSIDTFAIGGLLAWVKRGPGLPELPSQPVSIAGLVVLAAGCWAANRVIRYSSVNAWVDSLPEIFEGIVAVILVWGCVKGFSGWLGGFFSAAPLRFLGQISYGIFIYHLILFFFMEPYLALWGIGPKESPMVWSIVMLALTLAVSSASWFWLEKPVVRMAKRLIESRAGGRDKAAEE
jgi:peptidoglycan/LPS O-acetylase OafA/YrhL